MQRQAAHSLPGFQACAEVVAAEEVGQHSFLQDVHVGQHTMQNTQLLINISRYVGHSFNGNVQGPCYGLLAASRVHTRAELPQSAAAG
jgi:hypothetical protein